MRPVTGGRATGTPVLRSKREDRAAELEPAVVGRQVTAEHIRGVAVDQHRADFRDRGSKLFSDRGRHRVHGTENGADGAPTGGGQRGHDQQFTTGGKHLRDVGQCRPPPWVDHASRRIHASQLRGKRVRQVRRGGEVEPTVDDRPQSAQSEACQRPCRQQRAATRIDGRTIIPARPVDAAEGAEQMQGLTVGHQLPHLGGKATSLSLERHRQRQQRTSGGVEGGDAVARSGGGHGTRTSDHQRAARKRRDRRAVGHDLQFERRHRARRVDLKEAAGTGLSVDRAALRGGQAGTRHEHRPGRRDGHLHIRRCLRRPGQQRPGGHRHGAQPRSWLPVERGERPGQIHRHPIARDAENRTGRIRRHRAPCEIAHAGHRVVGPQAASHGNETSAGHHQTSTAQSRSRSEVVLPQLGPGGAVEGHDPARPAVEDARGDVEDAVGRQGGPAIVVVLHVGIPRRQRPGHGVERHERPDDAAHAVEAGEDERRPDPDHHPVAAQLGR